MSVMAVARDQAGDLIRRRYLIVILILCVALIGMWIGYLSLMKVFMDTAARGQPGGDRMSAAEARQMGAFMTSALQVGLLGTVSAIATILSLSLMAYSIRSDISKGMIRMVLSRPVRRWEYFLGKWLGCVFIVFVYWIVMGILVCVYTHFAFGGLRAIIPISLGMLFLKAVMVGSI
ncbi:MAG: ABC transporter permease subunit, partial [Armatimonadetes bacterium]|nr:ABC transporter permease subunit [Armatimonadota bacterium]